MCRSGVQALENSGQTLCKNMGLCTFSTSMCAFLSLPTHLYTFFTRAFSHLRNIHNTLFAASFSTLSTSSITTTIFIYNNKQVGGQEVLV